MQRPSQSNASPQIQIFPHISNQFAIQLMAFNGGFIDSAGYLKLNGLFVSSITGNLVVMAASVSTDRGLVARSLIVASFALGSFVLKQLMEVLRIFNMSFHFQLLFGHSSILLLVIVATIFGIIYNDAIDKASIDDWVIIFPACLLAISMGYQNTVCESSFRNAPPTTVMTMTLVRGANALSTALSQYVILIQLRKDNLGVAHDFTIGNRRRCDSDKIISTSIAPSVRIEAQKQLLDDIETHTHLVYNHLDKFVVISRPLVLFMIGSVIGAKLMEVLHFYSMIIPLFIISALVIELALTLIFRGTDFFREDFQTQPSSLSGIALSESDRIHEQLGFEKEHRQSQLQHQQVVLSASGINRLDSLKSMIDEDIR